MAVDADKVRGLYQKYRVQRIIDPEHKHSGCFYFVLDTKHDKYAVPALKAYAKACRREFPQLSTDLYKMADNIVQAETGEPPRRKYPVVVRGIPLADREVRLLQYAADERSDEDMARQLNCSVAATLRLKLLVMRKFKMDALRAVVLEAIRAGVVDPRPLPRPRQNRGGN